jgi:hypothetical protein
VSEPLDGLEAPLHRWIWALTFDNAEACHKLLTVLLAERWPPGLNCSWSRDAVRSRPSDPR